jgi:hypothetical protein
MCCNRWLFFRSTGRRGLEVQNQLGTEFFRTARSHTTKNPGKLVLQERIKKAWIYCVYGVQEACISWRSAAVCTQNVSIEIEKTQLTREVKHCDFLTRATYKNVIANKNDGNDLLRRALLKFEASFHINGHTNSQKHPSGVWEKP